MKRLKMCLLLVVNPIASHPHGQKLADLYSAVQNEGDKSSWMCKPESSIFMVLLFS